MKPHLLFEAQDFDLAAPLPAHHRDLVQDLELPAVLQAMARGDRFLYDVAMRVLLAGLGGPGEIVYRQRVLADCLAHPDVVRQLYDISVTALEDKRGLWGHLAQHPDSVLSGAVDQLVAFLSRLEALRAVADRHVDRFESAGMRGLLSGLQHDLDDDYLRAVGEHLRRLQFPGGAVMSMELGPDNTARGYVLRSAGPPRAGWKERLRLGERRSYSFWVPQRDEEGCRTLADMTNRGLNLVANAAAQSADHIMGYFTLLRAELGFYVGCLNLGEALAARGVPVTFPELAASNDGALSCADLRDVALALRSDGPVVGNDLQADGKSLIVVTGANSGGKSTFLRSLGSAQLMAQSGLFVTAAAFRTSVQRRVFTHFGREEDVTMTSGRLDEELARMSAIADDLLPQSLVLFNESFAATNEREGSEIGRQIVRALLEAGVRVCFVSHQYDFADSFYREGAGSALFLRAPRGEEGHRNFKLEVAEPLPTSFGEDIYRRLGGWFDEERPQA